MRNEEVVEVLSDHFVEIKEKIEMLRKELTIELIDIDIQQIKEQLRSMPESLRIQQSINKKLKNQNENVIMTVIFSNVIITIVLVWLLR